MRRFPPRPGGGHGHDQKSFRGRANASSERNRGSGGNGRPHFQRSDKKTKRGQVQVKNHGLKTKVCLEFQRTGECRFGEGCRYVHQVGDSRQVNIKKLKHQAPKPNRSNHGPMISRELTQLWKALSLQLKPKSNKTFSKFIKTNVTQWLELWQVAAGGAGTRTELHVLIRSLLRLPFVTSDHMLALCADHIVEVLRRSLDSEPELKSSKPAFQPKPEHLVTRLELVVDVIQKRLQAGISTVHRAHNYEAVAASLTKLDQSFKHVLSQIDDSDSSLFKRTQQLRYCRVYMREYREELTKLSSSESHLSSQELAPAQYLSPLHSTLPDHEQWTRPTLAWLLSPTWRNTVTSLDKSYASSEEYFLALLRLWSLLAFYWGAGALTPRCMHRQGNRLGDPNKP